MDKSDYKNVAYNIIIIIVNSQIKQVQNFSNILSYYERKYCSMWKYATFKHMQ